MVESGCAELFLSPDGREEIPLASFGRGEFFGELSLSDGERRSASARASKDRRCLLIEIPREAVLPNLTPVVTSMLGAVAARLRRTDQLVASLSDQVARSAYVNSHSAVAVELDAVKRLYQRTEKLAAETLEHAQERSLATLKQADDAAQAVSARFQDERSKLKRAATWIGAALAVFGISAGTWGKQVYSVGEDIKRQHVETELTRAKIQQAAADITSKDQQVQLLYAKLETLQHRLSEADRSLRIVRETMTDLRATREASGLGQRVDSRPQLQRIAQNYEQAKQEVLARYLAPNLGADEQRAFEPEVVFEAAMTYMTLASEGRDDKQLRLDARERHALIEALLYVLKNLPSARHGSAESGEASWVFERQLREAWRWLQYALVEVDRTDVRARLGEIMSDPLFAPPAHQNAALVYVRFTQGRTPTEHSKATAISILRGVLTSERGTLMSMSSALALAQLDDPSGWDQLVASLRDPASGYQAAAMLAEEGRDALVQLARKHAPGRPTERLIDQVTAALTHKHASASNCFEQRYASWLSRCLEGDCPTHASGAEPLGGPCVDPPEGTAQ